MAPGMMLLIVVLAIGSFCALYVLAAILVSRREERAIDRSDAEFRRRIAAMQQLLVEIEDAAVTSPDLTGEIILGLIRQHRKELP